MYDARLYGDFYAFNILIGFQVYGLVERFKMGLCTSQWAITGVKSFRSFRRSGIKCVLVSVTSMAIIQLGSGYGVVGLQVSVKMSGNYF